MFKHTNSLIQKYWHKWIEFLHFARNHRIELNPKDWIKGVLLLLIGWGLIGMDSVLFKEPLDSVDYKLNFVFQFSAGMLFIFVVMSLYFLFARGKTGVIDFLKVTHDNEVSGSAILDPRTRKTLIFTRGIIGAGGYIGFELARTAVGLVDNAVIYGADSLMYVILAVILLKERYNLFEKMGVLTTLIGIAIVVYFDLLSMNKELAIKGCALGLSSSFSLAIILILTSVIVQHDNPIRVVFYQCFYGLLISLVVLGLSFDQFDQINLTQGAIWSAIVEGFIYATAVVLLLQAFYYVNVIIVAISSYSLDLYSVLFNFALSSEKIQIQTLVSAALIAIGSGILIRAEYKKYMLKK